MIGTSRAESEVTSNMDCIINFFVCHLDLILIDDSMDELFIDRVKLSPILPEKKNVFIIRL